MPIRPDCLDTEFYTTHGEILVRSFKNLLGRDFIQGNPGQRRIIDILWSAPFAILSHGTEEDPLFNFGNKVALELFDVDFSALCKMHSRKSAEPVSQEERERMLDEVKQHGYIKNYSGVRVSAYGNKFHINAATVWNLNDMQGSYYGQAAMFTNWQHL